MFRLLSSLALMIGSPVALAQQETLVVANKGEDSVSFVALGSGEQIAKVPTGDQPHEIAISPDGETAAVVAYGGTTLDLIDVESHNKLRTIDISPNRRPHGIAWLGNDRLIVTAEDSHSVALVSRSGEVKSIPTDQQGTHMVVVSPDGRRAYTANIGSGTVSVLDLERRAKLRDIKVGGKPEGLALARDGRELWVGDLSDPRIQVIDLATDKRLAVLPVSPVAIRIIASPDGRYVAASAIDTGTIGLFDAELRVPLRTISVSDDGAAKQVTILFSPDSKRIYAAETARDTVAEVDVASGEVLRRFATGREGDGLAIAAQR